MFKNSSVPYSGEFDLILGADKFITSPIELF